MPFGFGRGFGRGWGRGWGNPYPYCRNFPWLPRWWWATPNAGQYANTIPYYGYGDSPDQFPYSPAPGQSAAQITPEQELDMLKGQTEILEDELEGIRKRITEIESSKTNKT
jgi:hypothetical protein